MAAAAAAAPQPMVAQRARCPSCSEFHHLCVSLRRCPGVRRCPWGALEPPPRVIEGCGTGPRPSRWLLPVRVRTVGWGVGSVGRGAEACCRLTCSAIARSTRERPFDALPAAQCGPWHPPSAWGVGRSTRNHTHGGTNLQLASSAMAGQQQRLPRLPHLDALDGVRVLACGSVLVAHTWIMAMALPGADEAAAAVMTCGDGRTLGSGVAGWVGSHGCAGVDVFLVCSAALATASLVGALRVTPAPGAWAVVRTYWWRRALRVLPPYYLALGVTAWVYGGTWPPGDAGSFGIVAGGGCPHNAWAGLLFVNNMFRWRQCGARVEAGCVGALHRPHNRTCPAQAWCFGARRCSVKRSSSSRCCCWRCAPAGPALRRASRRRRWRPARQGAGTAT